MESMKMSRRDTITVIRSLVAVQTKPYPLYKLLSDFKAEVGYTMPTFAYKSALDFLRSIPDTVKRKGLLYSCNSERVAILKASKAGLQNADEVIRQNNQLLVKPVLDKKSKAYLGSTIMESDLIPAGDKGASTSMKSNLPTFNTKVLPPVINKRKRKSKSARKRAQKIKNALESGNTVNPVNQSNSLDPDPSDSPDSNLSDLPNLQDLSLSHNVNKKKEKEKRLREYWEKRSTVLCLRCLSVDSQEDTVTVIDKCLSTIALRKTDIPFINITYYVDIGDDIEVSVTEVCNPHKFFLQFKRFRNELLKLMSSLQTFYNVYASKYAVEEYKFKTDQFCAALCSTNAEHKEWYRAKIVEFGEKMSIIFLIDYGTIVKIRNRDLKYLDRNYSQLPAQAVSGRLADIKPSDGMNWSEECCKKFYSLVFEKEVVARIININSEEHCMSVNLYYGDAGEIRVNRALVERGLADADCGCDQKPSFLSTVYESHKRKGFLKPEDIGMTRKTRVNLGDQE